MGKIGNAAFLAAAALASCSPAADAPLEGGWQLDPGQSRLAFVSVKAGNVAEAHRFARLSGSVTGAGEASLSIDLSSVETGIDVRDERMREFLFETGTYPEATVIALVDPAAFSALAVGESTVQPVEATLDLHGAQGTVAAELAVTRIGADRVKVETTAPIVVDAASYGLDTGLAKLQELAGLPGITPQVPVTFSLTFDRQD